MTSLAHDLKGRNRKHRSSSFVTSRENTKHAQFASKWINPMDKRRTWTRPVSPSASAGTRLARSPSIRSPSPGCPVFTLGSYRRKGASLSGPTTLKPGDGIDIGPFSLRFDGADLISRSRSNNIELLARGLKRVVHDRTTGQPIKLLDHINLVVRPREFVCILGPSGSGKSTLLAILSGRNPPDAGMVTLNGQDLYAHFEALKEDIAVVPQKDVLHDSLAVNTALRYTAELRLPSDTSREEVEASVCEILAVVGLTRRREMLIRHLSGGQVKRASLANELVSRPSLLFLDEVTSGLDEQTDREVMELFRQVADGGKTVVCITHSLANVEATCHLVVILTEGGNLAFIGTPDEAKAYFQIARLGDVYRRLAEDKPEGWHKRFRSSTYFQRSVVERMPSDSLLDEGKANVPARLVRGRASGFRQALVLVRRYVSIWRGDRQALLAILGQSLLVALLLGLVFGNLVDVSDPIHRLRQTVNLFLLLAVSSFWFGCNTAAKELVKERVIFLRERDFNLRVGSYFASKILVLTIIAVVQATLLFIIVRPWCRPPGPRGTPMADARRARGGRDDGGTIDFGRGPVGGGGDGTGADRGHSPDHPGRGGRSAERVRPISGEWIRQRSLGPAGT